MELLIERFRSLEIDHTNKLGQTALIKAAIQGRTNCARILLRSGKGRKAAEYCLKKIKNLRRRSVPKGLRTKTDCIGMGRICGENGVREGGGRIHGAEEGPQNIAAEGGGQLQAGGAGEMRSDFIGNVEKSLLKLPKGRVFGRHSADRRRGARSVRPLAPAAALRAPHALREDQNHSAVVALLSLPTPTPIPPAPTVPIHSRNCPPPQYPILIFKAKTPAKVRISPEAKKLRILKNISTSIKLYFTIFIF